VLRIWRLTKTKYSASAWDGEGAAAVGGRWNSVGTPVVYTSATLSLALVETLVHLPSGVLPAYTAIPIELPESLVTILESSALPPNWKDEPPPAATQALGDAWAYRKESVALKVPSVVVPEEFNYMLNPNHAEFARATIGTPRPFPFDPRLVVP
jgi:RES domain-containing protein